MLARQRNATRGEMDRLTCDAGQCYFLRVAARPALCGDKLQTSRPARQWSRDHDRHRQGAMLSILMDDSFTGAAGADWRKVLQAMK